MSLPSRSSPALSATSGAMGSREMARVAVCPADVLHRHARLFEALAQAFGVRFTAGPEGRPDAMIIVGAEPPVEPAVPTLSFVGDPGSRPVPGTVMLSAHPAVDSRLRSVALDDHPIWDGPAAGGGDAVLASTRGRACWTVSDGPAPHHRIWTLLPPLADDEVLRDALRTYRALGLVAIVQLVRSVVARAPEPPPLRATFVFDDPNLRRRSYGFLDYRRLVAHADAHGYHAGMAMIPLDASRPNRAAVDLFRSRPDRISLSIHGNNHVRRELLQDLAPADALALGAQALRRIGRFEGRTGLRVDRVMVPPHGMCSRAVAEGLGRLPYDALCAIHPCPWTEHAPPERLLAGWGPAEMIAGCAVIPRFPLTCAEAEVALRAFLDQPLVLYGHHDDLADGLEPLAQAAERVNRRGPVTWMSLGQIATTNATVAIDGETAVVVPHSGHVHLRLPRGTRRVAVSAPPGADRGDLPRWRLDGGPALCFGEAADVASDRAELALEASQATEPAAVASPPWRPWPVARRAATEARDRLLPLRRSASRR